MELSELLWGPPTEPAGAEAELGGDDVNAAFALGLGGGSNVGVSALVGVCRRSLLPPRRCCCMCVPASFRCYSAV